jgi:hypothetical protein
MEAPAEFGSRKLDLKIDINKNSIKEAWIPVPNLFKNSVIFEASGYYSTDAENRSKELSNGIHLSEGKQLLSLLKNDKDGDLTVIALTDKDGNIEKVKVGIKDKADTLMIEGDFLEAVAERYFFNKEEK